MRSIGGYTDFSVFTSTLDFHYFSDNAIVHLPDEAFFDLYETACELLATRSLPAG
jgi:hypothetical protein